MFFSRQCIGYLLCLSTFRLSSVYVLSVYVNLLFAFNPIVQYLNRLTDDDDSDSNVDYGENEGYVS